MSNQEFYHAPVLKNEIVSLLVTDKKGMYLDCTLGGGGHFRAIAECLEPGATMIGIDRDSDAIQWNLKNPVQTQLRVIIEQSPFSEFDKILEKHAISAVDGMLLDLGVSSWQIDNKDRGFSFMGDGELDMRMNRSYGISAAEFITSSSEAELCDVLDKYGEVQNPKRMARTIKQCSLPILTTLDLKNCLTKEYGPNLKYKVLAKVFQAIRIAVNDELGELQRFLEKSVRYLKPSGRIAVMAYHSLEDRIVKEFFRSGEQGCICPPSQPVCTCKRVASLKRITRKSLQADDAEIARNPRSRSVRVRVVEKIA
jgi:16S rRNA (cytosine1402-N4)-methyltransferase